MGLIVGLVTTDELVYVLQRIYENSSPNPTGQIYFIYMRLQNASSCGGLYSPAETLPLGPTVGLSSPRLLVQSAATGQGFADSRHASDLRFPRTLHHTLGEKTVRHIIIQPVSAADETRFCLVHSV